MIEKLQKRFALSRQGAIDMIKGCLACVLQNISFMIPVGLLYQLVLNAMNGELRGSRIPFYVIGILACLVFIFGATWVQYNATFLATYVESGVRRISLAEQMRKIPLSFFGKKDLADLTNSIMSDCATLETAFSHFVPGLAGSIISTALIGICLFAINVRMAVAAVWVLPVAFAITFCSARVQEQFSRRSVAANVDLEAGIQECLESLQDLKSVNAQAAYLRGLNGYAGKTEYHRGVWNGSLRRVLIPGAEIRHPDSDRHRSRTSAARGDSDCDFFHVSAGCFQNVYTSGRRTSKSGSCYFYAGQYQSYE